MRLGQRCLADEQIHKAKLLYRFTVDGKRKYTQQKLADMFHVNRRTMGNALNDNYVGVKARG